VSLLRALFACGLYQLLRVKDLHAKELFFFSFPIFAPTAPRVTQFFLLQRAFRARQ
jgi:hypothetical protein